MIIIKEEFTAGQFDLPFVKIYSVTSETIKNKKTGEIYKADYNHPLIIPKNREEEYE